MKTDAPLTPPATQPWRVVIIDDNPADRADIRRMLLKGSGRRYQFAEAETGAAGVRAVLDAVGGPPDCVVLDYGLPDTDAVEVLAAIAGSHGLTICPVVVLTGTDGHEHARKVLRAGAQDYLGKGWMTPESLTRAVENAAERHHLTRELQDRERALRASEERFRLAARVAGLAVAEIDYGADQILLSPEAAASFGLPAEPASVPRATVHALFHPDDRSVLAALIAASHDPAGTGEFNLEHRIIRPDGRVRWHSVRKQVFFEGGRPARALLALFDITERKRADEGIRQNAELFGKIIEQAPGGVYVMDAQLRVREVNNEALPVFANAQPVIGRELGEVLEMLWGPEIGRQCTDIVRRTLETGERHVSPRFDHLRQDIGEQQVYEWETHRIMMPDGQHGVVCYFQDVTAREHAASALRLSENRFRSLAEGMPHCVWVCDTEGNNEYQSRQWYEYTGAMPGTCHGTDWLDFYHPDDRSHLQEEWNRALRSGGSYSYDIQVRIRRHDGEYRWFRVKGSPIADRNSVVVRWAGTCTDIHEQRMLLQALREADRRKDEFLATLAHELRNPLAPMRAAVQFLRVKGPPDPDLQWARDVIDRQTRAMARLIDDLMDVSRINRGKVELRREHVELAKVVQGAVETSRPLIEEMGHELTVTLPPGPVILDADLTRLAQVFLNLLNNAAKYTDRGGRIDLRAELQGSDVVVSVKDTGIGISADKLPTIFEMFSQVEGALSRSQGGLGIGLSLVKSMVEMHGGSVQATSAGLGKGSEFLARLPIVVEKTDARTTSDDADRTTPTSSLRILVVDDNRDAAAGLAKLLNAMGNTVHAAYDGEEAVAAAKVVRPHVVLCDIGLPKLNGYEACRRIKKDAWDGSMLLIAVTGWGQDDDRQKAQEAGFDQHMVKPVDTLALMKLLAGLYAVKA